jgi:hypothetical protein
LYSNNKWYYFDGVWANNKWKKGSLALANGNTYYGDFDDTSMEGYGYMIY